MSFPWLILQGRQMLQNLNLYSRFGWSPSEKRLRPGVDLFSSLMMMGQNMLVHSKKENEFRLVYVQQSNSAMVILNHHKLIVMATI